ncbi:hypothetical protein B296_00047258 [Ensete ventricosum]|uniref:Uncharacterized protein n=1 Tax=Ensete ventricosum TaxID=4639 RepID=A0A426YM71_ENSVE|nr:hypothetical protein B296_00047258 [Ensete ventricosum]
MTSPNTGPTTHGQGQPEREASDACEQKRRPRAQPLAARRLQRGLVAGHPQEAAANRGGCPLAGRLPADKGSYRLRRGSGSDDDA